MGRAVAQLIDDELERFIQGPVSSMLGTTDAMAVPDATRVAGVAVLDDRRMRVLISTEARTARANAVSGAAVAVSVTDIRTYRSVQWKGRVLEPAADRTPGDVALLHRHVEAFTLASPTVGIPAELAGHLFPVEVVALVVELDERYDQTPGPGAGSLVASVRP